MIAPRLHGGNRAAFVAAVVASVVSHGMVAWSVYDVPIGHIDLRFAGASRPVQRVRLVDPSETLVLDTQHTDALTHEPLDLKAVGAALLDPPAPALPDADLPLGLQPVDDDGHGPDALTDVDLPQARMAEVVERKLVGRLPLEVAFVAGDAEGAAADPFATRGGQGGGSAEAAARLLQRAGLGQTAHPQPLALARPTFSDSAVIDRQSVQTPLEAAHIDFAALALRGTTRLRVPEHLDNDFDYDVQVFRPDKGPGFFRVDLTGRKSLIKLRAMPKDVVILVDTSGSVPQPWVKATIQGVKDALAALNPRDRFNIVLFKDTPSLFNADRIQPFGDATLAAALAFLDEASSGGYTDLNHILSRLLVRDIAVERVYYIILISDGRPTRGVMDTRALINRITRDNNLAASIYCIGIGPRQNRKLLDYLAHRNKGYSLFVPRIDRAAPTVRELFSRLRYPILKDVRLNVVGVAGSDVFPNDLANIHQSERFQIYGKFDQRSIGPLTIRVRGTNLQESFDFTFSRDLRVSPRGDAAISRAWAFQKLHHLYGELLRGPESAAVKAQIDELRRQYKLKTLY